MSETDAEVVHRTTSELDANSEVGPETQDFLSPISGPELVFGLVGPIGTDLKSVSHILSDELSKVGYTAYNLHVTDFLYDIDFDFSLQGSPLEKRYASYIEAGNFLRTKLNRADVFALLSVAAIRKKRLDLTGDRDSPKFHSAYILSQFKKPEEIKTLRAVYGDAFIQISAFCSKPKRLGSLTKRIAESHYGERSEESYKGTAHDLIVRDADEEEHPFGQRVRDTFPLADVVINADTEDSTRVTCARFIRAFFGEPFTTPTRDEYGAYTAKAVSLRSSDLSRQVGAVIFTSAGEMISAGCNEVPKPNGGTYWEGDNPDWRDFRLSYDSSVRVKHELLQDIFRRLKENNWLSETHHGMEISELVEEALFSDKQSVMQDAQIMNILEYGRIIHAEMSAICDAARLGRSVNSATLYCTTFQCHNCARHIIAAGINRVVYIEPYSKSFAGELYKDSVNIEEDTEPNSDHKVNFEPFIGIGPQRYDQIFSKGKRKDSRGNAEKWNPKNARPIIEQLVPAYLKLETALVSSLDTLLFNSGLNTKQNR